jgi:serine/threonine protein phosphatase PrpC
MSVERTGPVRLHGLTLEAAGISAQGPRSENQDAFALGDFARTGLLAVADGMGGERAGRMAADTALGAVSGLAPLVSVDAARYALRAADEAVARAAQMSPDERGGMGCAFALLCLAQGRGGEVGWVSAHVGDVRVISRSPDGTVRLETRDHTPAFARWEAGEIALDEIPDSPGSNRLQRAVGRGGEADAGWIPARPGWSYLLVSDGVTKAMRLDELGRAIVLEPAAACEAIYRKVEERGPDDNFTAVAVRILGLDDSSVTQESPRRPAAANPAPPATAMPARRSSPLAGLAALLGVLALALAGFATYTALGTRRDLVATTDSMTTVAGRVQALETRLTPPDSTPRDSSRTAVDSLTVSAPRESAAVPSPATPPR